MVLLSLMGEAEAVSIDAATASLGLVLSLITAALLAVRRTYQAVDTVIYAVENKTVEFVEAVGYESVRAAPIYSLAPP